jgi:hypothetical protein
MSGEEAVKKANDIITKVRERIEKINNFIDKYILSIQYWIRELERLAKESLNHSVEWISKKLENIRNKIKAIVKKVKDWVNNQIQAIRAWFDYSIYMMKIAFIKASFAMINIELTEEDIISLGLFESIPCPSAKEIIPDIDVEQQITKNVPGVKEVMNMEPATVIEIAKGAIPFPSVPDFSNMLNLPDVNPLNSLPSFSSSLTI